MKSPCLSPRRGRRLGSIDTRKTDLKTRSALNVSSVLEDQFRFRGRLPVWQVIKHDDGDHDGGTGGHEASPMKSVHEGGREFGHQRRLRSTREVRRGNFGRLHRTLRHVQLMRAETVTAKWFERSTNCGTKQRREDRANDRHAQRASELARSLVAGGAGNETTRELGG